MAAVEHPDAPAGKATKYARPELERRFLLARLPDAEPVRRVRILDRYISGTRLRLRRMTALDSAGQPTATVEFKLGQKIPKPDGTPGLITNLYLSAAEYEALEIAPAAVLEKVRLSLPPLGVDLFEGALAGLILAEAEFDRETEARAFEPPVPVVAEVTADIRFTGGLLVTTTAEALRALLAEFGLRPEPR
jgi:CYTH domain-containing protein